MAQVDKKEAYNTGCSQAVTHPSTDPARRCLTSVIGREPVHSAWYGRRRQTIIHAPLYRYKNTVRDETPAPGKCMLTST